MFNFLSSWFSTAETFAVPDWPNESPIWEKDALDLLLADATAEEPENVTVKKVLENSEKFPLEFPIDSVRCKTLTNIVSNETLENYINSAYYVLHERVLHLCSKFLLYKRKYGSDPERDFYANLSLLQLVERFLSKRAATFLGGHDFFMLVDGTSGHDTWECIGTSNETDKLNLSNCLSYDENKLSAFLGISSFTRFINDGSRYNRGVTNMLNVEPEGVIVGLTGTRFQKPGLMEYAEMLIRKDLNKEENGYGDQREPTLHTIFADFYEEPCFTFGQAMKRRNEDRARFKQLHSDRFFDNTVFCKRIALTLDTFLVEANQRAKEKNTSAFVHVVGLGLGAWVYSPHQETLYLDTFAKRIEILGDKLHSISDVVLAYFSDNATCAGYKDDDIIPIAGHPKGGIKIHISKREPHLKLSGEDEGKLLVVSYAWNGNALPGNDFWLGTLSSSGDPAAACSTQIAELHNPHINPKLRAETLRVVTPNGLFNFQDYCQRIKEN